MFLVKLLIFFVIDLAVSVIVGVKYGEEGAMACALVLGLAMAIVWYVITEVASWNTPTGREQQQRIYEREKKIEKYYGHIDYYK